MSDAPRQPMPMTDERVTQARKALMELSRQLIDSHEYAREENPSAVPSMWQIQNGHLRDCLARVFAALDAQAPRPSITDAQITTALLHIACDTYAERAEKYRGYVESEPMRAAILAVFAFLDTLPAPSPASPSRRQAARHGCGGRP